MDLNKNEDQVIVLDCGQDVEEVAAMAACCKGRPSAAATASADR